MPSTRRNKGTDDVHSTTPTGSAVVRGRKKSTSEGKETVKRSIQSQQQGAVENVADDGSDSSTVKQVAPVTGVKRSGAVQKTQTKKAKVSAGESSSEKKDDSSKGPLLCPRRSSRAAVPNSRYKDMVDPSVKLPSGTPEGAETAAAKARQQRRPKQTSPKVVTPLTTNDNIIFLNEHQDESGITEEVVTDETPVDRQTQRSFISMDRRLAHARSSKPGGGKETQHTEATLMQSSGRQPMDACRATVNVLPASVNSTDKRSLLLTKGSKQSPSVQVLNSATTVKSTPSASFPQIVDSMIEVGTTKNPYSNPKVKVPVNKDTPAKLKTATVPLVSQSVKSPASPFDSKASKIVISSGNSKVTHSSESHDHLQTNTTISKLSGSKVVYQQKSDSKGRTVLSVPYKSGAVKVVNVPMKTGSPSLAKVVTPRVIRKVVKSNEGSRNLLIKTPAQSIASINPVVSQQTSTTKVETETSTVQTETESTLTKPLGLKPNVKVIYLKGSPSTISNKSPAVLSKTMSTSLEQEGIESIHTVTQHADVISSESTVAASDTISTDTVSLIDSVDFSQSDVSKVDTSVRSEQSNVDIVVSPSETITSQQNIEIPVSDAINVSMEPVLVESLCQVIEYKGGTKKKTSLGAGLEGSEGTGKQTRYGRVEVPRSVTGGPGMAQQFQIHHDKVTPKYDGTTAGMPVSSGQTSIGTVIAQLEETHPAPVVQGQGPASSHGGRVMHGYIDLSRKGTEHIETEIVEISPDLFTREVYGEAGTPQNTTDTLMEDDQVIVSGEAAIDESNKQLILQATSGDSSETPSQTLHIVSSQDTPTADDEGISVVTTTLTSMTGLEEMTATHMGDGVIRIDGLDLASLDKNTIVTVEKISSGEDAVVLHTGGVEGEGEQGSLHKDNVVDTDSQQSDTFKDMVQNPVSSDDQNILPKKLVTISRTGKSYSYSSKPVHPAVRAMPDVKITPVRAYVADKGGSQVSGHIKQVYHDGGAQTGNIVAGEIVGEDTEVVAGEAQGEFMGTGAVSVSTSTNTQTDDSDSDSQEPIEVHWDGEKYILGSEETHPLQVKDSPNEGDAPYQELVIVQLPEGSEVKQYKVRPIVRQNTIIEETVTKDEDGNYICVDCDHKTDKRSNWYKHRRRHLGIKPHACPKCSYRAATSSNLKRHMQIHDDIRSFHCDICGLNFRQKIHLLRHYKYKHQEKKVQCPLCDFSCTAENPDLKIHIRKRHMPMEGSMDDFTCKTCGLMTVSKKDLKQHQKFHKKGPELKLFCEHCSFVTDCMSRLRRHLCVHTKERPFQCGLCPYRASQKEHVLRHMRSQHNVEVEPRQKRSLLDIRTIVKEDNVIIPKDSDAQPVLPSKYRKPDPDSDSDGTVPFEKVDFSNQDKIFACNHCSMKFARLINLYKHLYAQHSLVMPSQDGNDHQCVVCDFRTTSKKNLLVHMRKHNAQDHSPPSHVYSCVLCRYINPKRRNLFQHMKKKHGIEIIMKEDGLNCFVTIDTDGSKGEGHAAIANEIALSEIVKTEEVNSETSLQIMVAEDGSTYRDHISIENIIPIDDMSEYETSSHSDQQVLVSPQIVHATVQEHEAAEAIEGLQALAEQAGILETQNIDNDMTTEIVSAEIMNDGEISIAPNSSEGEAILQSHQVLEIEGATQGYEVVEDLDGSAAEMGGTVQGASVGGEERAGDIQLSPEQLNQLTTGDYVEINGEVYKVEIAPENNEGLPV